MTTPRHCTRWWADSCADVFAARAVCRDVEYDLEIIGFADHNSSINLPFDSSVSDIGLNSARKAEALPTSSERYRDLQTSWGQLLELTLNSYFLLAFSIVAFVRERPTRTNINPRPGPFQRWPTVFHCVWGTTRAVEKRKRETRVNVGGLVARRLKMRAVVKTLRKTNVECWKSDGKTCMQQILLQAVIMN